MLRNSMRRIHKWIFIFVGIFMLLWALTGVIISLPVHMEWMGAEADRNSQIDYSQITLNPADAIAALGNQIGKSGAVRSLHFEQIRGHTYYAVEAAEGKKYLIDTKTGEPFHFSASFAESTVRKLFKVEKPVIENILIQNHSLAYPYGELPVYRIRFDETSAYFYVSPVSAKVHRSSVLTRIRAVAGMFHDFGPITYLTGRDVLRWGSMVLIGVIALAGTLTGLYLIFPIRKKRRQIGA